jgi:diacylglycerol kinase (ATP)
MRTLAIVNPVAGNGKAPRIWRRIRAEVSIAQTWECVWTERVGHARELAADAVKHGYDRVVALGGDGTVGEVASGLAHTETALGIVPLGTGNDSALNLGTPTDPLAAAAHAGLGSDRSIDLGQVRTAGVDMYFVNVASFGFDAEVAWRVNRLPWMKVMGGTAPYVLGVLQGLLHYRAVPMRIRLDGQVLERAVFLVAVANSPSYGGGMRIAPRAQPHDGVLDLCVVRDLSRLEVLRLMPRLYSGGHVGHPAVELLRGCEIVAESEARVRCQADGELAGDLPATFTVAPRALRCVTAASF